MVNNNNKSMYIYTALIFFVAIILIIISFFGQSNVQDKQPAVKENISSAAMGEGITQKTSILSSENAELLNENIDLKGQLKSKEDQISFLYDENSALDISIENYSKLISVYQYLQQEKTEDAKSIFSAIVFDELTDEQKVIYEDLKNILG